MNVGLFGGTFNPFHNGHIGIITHIKELFDMEKIFLIPSSTPPHKSTINLAPSTDRFNMVAQSIEGIDGLEVSDKELVREGPSFTIDTLHEFKSEYISSTQFFLLMGSDAFLDIMTWKNMNEIFDMAQIIIMLRGNWDNYNQIASFIDENISKGYILKKKDHTFYHDKKKKISICKVPRIDISSTLIPNNVKLGHPIKDLVPKAVEHIIRTKELYQ